MKNENLYPSLRLREIQEKGLAGFIEQTLLKPEATPAQIEQLCSEALEFNFKGVCVHSSFVPLVQKQLNGAPPLIVSVVGFPSGAIAPAAVAFEAGWAVEKGAQEIDMVIPVGLLKAKEAARDQEIHSCIRTVVKAAEGALVKVIIETALLTEEEKTRACKISVEAGAHFVKTCTGFAGGGATEADVQLMKSIVGPGIGVKASGGVRSTEVAIALLLAGAHRLGTSSGAQLVKNTTVGTGY